MRQIKFRAWCEGRHDYMTFIKPYMDYEVTLSPKGNYCSVESYWDIQGEYETVPIMQFTGLLDKNGVEIYEGDLVRVEKKRSFDYHYKVTSEIIYQPQSGRFHAKGTYCDNLAEFINVDGVNCAEVIGNIHEKLET